MTAAVLDLGAALDRAAARRWLIVGIGVAVLVVTMLVSTGLGVVTLSPLATLRALTGAAGAEIDGAVIRELRLPRTLMAVIAGAGLALAGTAMQGITRNPLVSPFTIGISPAAGFGASLAILAGWSGIAGYGDLLLVLCAFVAAIGCAAIVLGLAALRGVTATMVILAGVGLTYFFGALTAAVQFVATEQQLAAIVHWTFGSLNGSTWREVAVSGGILCVVAPLLLRQAWALNAIAAGGDEVALSLGFAVRRVRTSVMLLAVLVTAGIVSFVGVIGFVGLVAPHIARLIVGADHRTLMPFAAIAGALLLLLADLAGRLVFAPVIVPVGIVVAFLGVPLFLHLLLTRRDEFAA